MLFLLLLGLLHGACAFVPSIVFTPSVTPSSSSAAACPVRISTAPLTSLEYGSCLQRPSSSLSDRRRLARDHVCSWTPLFAAEGGGQGEDGASFANVSQAEGDASGGVDESSNPYTLQYQVAQLADNLKGTPIYFVGMMGTGKSTIADKMARLMRVYRLIDTDDVIEQLLGTSISEHVEKEGMESLRDIETAVLDQVHAYVKVVVATGGGIILRNNNWAKMQTGLVIWLNMPVEHIAQRLSEHGVAKRPLLAGGNVLEKLTAIHEERREKYELADVHVHISPEDTPEDVCSNIVQAINEFIASNPPKYEVWKKKAQDEGVSWLQ